MPVPQYQFLIPAQPEVGQDDFEHAARLLKRRAGIMLGSHKREMAARTLSTRSQKLGLESIAQYLTVLEQNQSSAEWNAFINAFTINHTAFFREQHHFEILSEFVRTRKSPISVWCAAASTGEEPYTIAMTLRESLQRADDSASIWATDIDTQALERARRGVYSLERVKTVPEYYLKKYFHRGKDSKAGLARVKPAIYDMIRFDQFNLLSPSWPTDQKFDAIFCRNTMIYFDKPTQTRILERFASVMKKGGVLFAGHSENFTYLTKAFQLRGQTVYTVVS
ncbi:MAG TPA: CheR family methyltransferase [Eoetvoesiella sp.]|uniref:CheR family methyltransferase n=1 Tax=Eoetvoesiella sp. TaxID=1966355 RepID=UPI002BBFB307|nr:CheR family methyltransferase [Eoetvoesiella sp.]HWK59941.1 CheR family methyltransferase [Eoetvoesiella sp.]